MLIYIKVELALSSGQCGQFGGFDRTVTHSFVIPFKTTLSYEARHYNIQSGDTLVFGNIVLLIRTICHYGPNTTPMTHNGEPLFIAEPLVYDNEHDLLLAFDEFKSTFDLLHLGVSAPPKPYYLLYRSLVSINIDRTRLDTQVLFTKVIAEIIRAIFISEFPDEEFNDRFSESSTYIEWLYQIMLESGDTHGTIDLLEVVKHWEPMVNDTGLLKWTTSKIRLMDVIRRVFERSKILKDGFKYLS